MSEKGEGAKSLVTGRSWKQWFPCASVVIGGLGSKRIWGLMAGLATLIAIAWQVENFRGLGRFEAAKQRLIQAGVSLDWKAYHRKPAISDSENIAKQPPFDSIRVEPITNWGGGQSYYADIEAGVEPLLKGLPRGLSEEVGNLEGWAEALAPSEGEPSTTFAARVLEATDHLRPQIEELHEALQLDQCQWMTLDFEPMKTAPVPQISDMTDTTRRLAALLYTRARAHLECGEPGAAAREVVTVLKFAELMRFEQGSLVGALVRIALSGLTTNEDLSRLLSHEGWDAPSLQRVQGALRGIDLLGHLHRSFKAEISSMQAYGEALTNGEDWARDFWREGFHFDFGPEFQRGQWLHAFWRGARNRFYQSLPLWMPRGWHGQNLARVAEWWEVHLLSWYDPERRRILRVMTPDVSGFMDAPVSPYNFIAKITIPQISDFSQSAAQNQTRWDLLALKCALQRHRLQFGGYPERLNELLSKGFIDALPHDYMTGEEPLYERLGETFSLAALDWERSGDSGDFLCHLEEE